MSTTCMTAQNRVIKCNDLSYCFQIYLSYPTSGVFPPPLRATVIYYYYFYVNINK